ncbi:kyphoscoliosis peptidase-like [Ambystoma mexicanum]|uniref:kyphoscoliosis peptidase-like n=1 Tax=Ambystoma mexicanum TaxID=8296 RepID=UPI0037E7F317
MQIRSKMGCGNSVPTDMKISHSYKSISSDFSLTSNANNNNNHKGVTDTKSCHTSSNENSLQTSKDVEQTINESNKILDLCNRNTPPQHKRKPKETNSNRGEKLHLANMQNEANKYIRKKVTHPKTTRETERTNDTTDTHTITPRKNAFQFWEKKVGNTSHSGEDQQRKKSDKSCPEVKPTNPLSIRDIVSAVPGSNRQGYVRTDLMEKDSNGTVISPRRPARKLFTDSKDFIHIDRRVLKVSEQINVKEGCTIQSLVRQITQGTQSDLEKLRALWTWLCHNIQYDVDGFFGVSEKLFEPEDVLRVGRGVCSGYAGLFKEMCREIELPCQEVSGYSRGAGYRQGQSCQQKKSDHMWNAIKLEDEWYLLDACWGAGTVDLQKRLFVPRYDDFFFLTDPHHFIESHWPDDPKWQLMQPMVSFEEFEQRVFKTSEFFKLHLYIISPQFSIIRTVHGEATVSLGFKYPTEFTYQLSRLGDEGPTTINKPHGILTVSERGMKLCVIPPTVGLFDLMIFAKPTDTQDAYRWVCSYQIECLESKSLESLPENPFHFWGLHQKVGHFGIKGSNCCGEPIATDTGTVNLSFETSRPLLAMYELVHEGLDESMSKKCIVSQIEEHKFSCHVSCLLLGYYRMSVFVKNPEEEQFKNAANILIHCSCPGNRNELFPSGLSNHCGPGFISQRTGLSNPSHPTPIINTKLGKCNITFHTSSDLEVTAVLGKDQLTNTSYPMERYILLTHLEQKITVSILLPESGLYKVGLFARNSEESEFLHVCDYVIRCFTDPRQLPFPRVYSSWKKGCTLLQPRSGVLQEESWIRLRLKIPGASKVVAMGSSKVELHLTMSNIWEGDVFTGHDGNILKVMAKFSPHSKSMNVILSYDIGEILNNVNGTSG